MSTETPTDLKTGDRVQLDIDRLAYGGDALGHLADGRICFVRGAVPGDRVEVRLVQLKKRHARAELNGIIEAAADRIKPFCENASRCGGCPWQWTPIQIQRDSLHGHLVRNLARTEPAIAERIGPMVAAEPDVGWRSTARLHWDSGRLGFKKPRTNSVTGINHCPAMTPELKRVHTALREGLGSYLKGEGIARISCGPGEASGTIALEPSKAPPRGLWEAAEALVESDGRIHGITMKMGREWHPVGRPWNLSGPAKTVHPAQSFMQAHQPGTALLVSAVVEAIGPDKSVLELFAGSGNFTFPLVEAGCTLTTVEVDGAAVKALQREARKRKITESVTVKLGQATRLPGGSFDVALIDPPRSGARAALAALNRLAIDRIVYVSCDPATLARDVSQLNTLGWQLVSAQPFDLFPHTGHVEALAILERTAK